MSDFLGSLEDYLWLIFLLAIAVAFTVPQFLDFARTIALFFRVLLSPKKELITTHVKNLLDLPTPLAQDTLKTFEIHQARDENFDDLVLRYTTPVDEPVGINDSGKVTTKYYLDFVAACCDAAVLKRVATSLAFLITRTLKKKDYTFDYIISMSKSNVLIGLEISKILERPFIVAGRSSGADLSRFPTSKPNMKLKFILVDGIISSGEEVLNVARMVHAAGHELRYAFMVVDRCFHARDRLREESPFPYSIELFCVCDYDDRRIAELIGQSMPGPVKRPRLAPKKGI